jgi:hypothetical protein
MKYYPEIGVWIPVEERVPPRNAIVAGSNQLGHYSRKVPVKVERTDNGPLETSIECAAYYHGMGITLDFWVIDERAHITHWLDERMDVIVHTAQEYTELQEARQRTFKMLLHHLQSRPSVVKNRWHRLRILLIMCVLLYMCIFSIAFLPGHQLVTDYIFAATILLAVGVLLFTPYPTKYVCKQPD